MRYLHGDSSPFPLNENFLETLADATDCCVGLLHGDGALAGARDATQHAEGVAAGELERIDALARAVAEAVNVHGAAEPNSATEAAAIRIAELAQSAIDDARTGINDWRTETVREANASVPDVLGVLAQFLIRHQLPNTSWGLQWRAGLHGAAARAQAHSITPDGLNGTFEVRLPMEHLWALPVKIASLEKSAIIQVMRKGWLSGAKLREEHLDRYYITSVQHSNDRIAMVLSRSGKEPSDGLEVRVRQNDSQGLAILPVDPEGRALAKPVELIGEDAAVVQRIWEKVEATIADLLWYRSELRVATWQGTPIRNVQNPEEVAKVIIDAIAPVVREIRAHSRSVDELTLKRDLGDGRREELFVSYQEILGKLAGLTPEHQALFDAYGLDEGSPRKKRRRTGARATG